MSTQFQNITDLIERLEDAAMFITYQGATPEKEAALNAARKALLNGIFAQPDLQSTTPEMDLLVNQAHAYVRQAGPSELYEKPLTDDTMRAIRTRALDEFGTGQAQGELWDQILMRETARTIQAAAKGGA